METPNKTGMTRADADADARASRREARAKAAAAMTRGSSADHDEPEAATITVADLISRRPKLTKEASSRGLSRGSSSRLLGLERGSSSRGLGGRARSSRQLKVDDDNEEEEEVVEETFKSSSSKVRRVPRRTTSMDTTTDGKLHRRTLQRTKSCDGSEMPFRRSNQRRPTLALAERSTSIRRGLGTAVVAAAGGRGGLSRARSERRLAERSSADRSPLSEDKEVTVPRRRRDANSPAFDGSNGDLSGSSGSNINLVGSSTRRKRGSVKDIKTIGKLDDSSQNGSGRFLHRTKSGTRRRGTGLSEDSSNANIGGSRRRGIGRTPSGLGDSSQGKRASITTDDRQKYPSRTRSGDSMEGSGNGHQIGSRRRGVARTSSGIGNADTMRRRQTQRWVENVTTKAEEVDDEEDDEVLDAATDDEVLRGRGIGDSTRRRKEPTLSRMSINDLRSRLVGSKDEEEEAAEVHDNLSHAESSEGDIWNVGDNSGPLNSNLNDD